MSNSSTLIIWHSADGKRVEIRIGDQVVWVGTMGEFSYALSHPQSNRPTVVK